MCVQNSSFLSWQKVIEEKNRKTQHLNHRSMLIKFILENYQSYSTDIPTFFFNIRWLLQYFIEPRKGNKSPQSIHRRQRFKVCFRFLIQYLTNCSKWCHASYFLNLVLKLRLLIKTKSYMNKHTQISSNVIPRTWQSTSSASSFILIFLPYAYHSIAWLGQSDCNQSQVASTEKTINFANYSHLFIKCRCVAWL